MGYATSSTLECIEVHTRSVVAITVLSQEALLRGGCYCKLSLLAHGNIRGPLSYSLRCSILLRR